MNLVLATRMRSRLGSTLRRFDEPNRIPTIEIRWRPAHKGVPGNEKADGWAKFAAECPDARGAERKQYTDQYGRRPVPLARSLAHLKREISEKKWQEAKAWADLRATGKKCQYYRRGKVRQKPDPAPTKSNKRLAARFYQSKTSHFLAGPVSQVDQEQGYG